MISDSIDDNTAVVAAEPPKAKSKPTKKAKPTKKPAKKTAARPSQKARTRRLT
jgi:hypothetical protein